MLAHGKLTPGLTGLIPQKRLEKTTFSRAKKLKSQRIHYTQALALIAPRFFSYENSLLALKAERIFLEDIRGALCVTKRTSRIALAE